MFHSTSKPTFRYMYKFFERGPFRGMTSFLANQILAYLVTTDPTEFICRRFYPMISSNSPSCLALILVGLHPLIESAERPEMCGQLSRITPTGGLFPTAHSCMFPPYQEPVPTAAAEAPPLTPTRPQRPQVLPLLRTKEQCEREAEGVCLIQQGINVEGVDSLTIEVMSFTVHHADDDNFLDNFHAWFGHNAVNFYPAMVYTFTTFKGTIDPIQVLFERQENDYFCLKNFAILGISQWWYANLDNDTVDRDTYRFPALILDESYLLQTLDLVDDLKIGSAITELIVEFSDLDQRTPRYRRCSLIFWVWAQESNDLSHIPAPFRDDGDLLQDTTMQLIAMIPATNINTVDTLYNWEAVLALTDTDDCKVTRLNFISYIISNLNFPLRQLDHFPSLIDLTPFDQVWQHFEELETPEGDLLSYDTLSRYATRLIDLVHRADSEEFHALVQDSLQERYTLENPEAPQPDSDDESDNDSDHSYELDIDSL
jgi:hypothetical protein